MVEKKIHSDIIPMACAERIIPRTQYSRFSKMCKRDEIFPQSVQAEGIPKRTSGSRRPSRHLSTAGHHHRITCEEKNRTDRCWVTWFTPGRSLLFSILGGLRTVRPHVSELHDRKIRLPEVVCAWGACVCNGSPSSLWT